VACGSSAAGTAGAAEASSSSSDSSIGSLHMSSTSRKAWALAKNASGWYHAPL
jgi:hypothetical protein